MHTEIRHTKTSIVNPDYGMSREDAKDILSHYKSTGLISRVYDYGRVAEALLSLIPGFEYPEFSWHTIQYALDYAEEIYKLKI